MKKILVGILIFTATPAYANEGAWVKVDANGNAIGGAIVCDAGTCGAGSLYSQLTLQPGERYVQQTVADASGNVVGIGNQNPDINVKVDLTTNEWTTTTKEIIEAPIAGKTQSTVDKTNIFRINNDASTTLINTIGIVDTKITQTPPLNSEIPEELQQWYLEWELEWAELFKWLADLFKDGVFSW